MGGGLTDWHRQNRKRTLQKNKEQRLAARDAKVKETKTVSSVKEEIRSLERRFKDEQTRPHAIRTKLDRLRKELKLVEQQQQESGRTTGNAAANTQRKHHNSHSSQHRRGPHEQSDQQQRQQHQEPETKDAAAAAAPNRKSEPQLSLQRPKRYGKAVAGVWADNPEEEELDGFEPVLHGEGVKDQKKSNQRAKKQNDSEEKMSSPVALSKEAEEQWFYKDQAGKAQGPFPTNQMSQWITANFFPPTTLVRPSTSAAWTALQNTSLRKDGLPCSSREEEKQIDDGVHSRSKQDETVQVDNEGSNLNEEEPLEVESKEPQQRPQAEEQGEQEDSVERRIAALRAKHVLENQPEPPVPQQLPPTQQQQPDSAGDTTSANIQEASMASINYPVHPEEAMESGGNGDMAFVPYPVHNDDNDEAAYHHEYPVSGYPDQFDQDGMEDDGYPVVSGEYPVSDPYYPGVDNQSNQSNNEPRKKARVEDAEVVSLLPSHVRRKT